MKSRTKLISTFLLFSLFFTLSLSPAVASLTVGQEFDFEFTLDENQNSTTGYQHVEVLETDEGQELMNITFSLDFVIEESTYEEIEEEYEEFESDIMSIIWVIGEGGMEEIEEPEYFEVRGLAFGILARRHHFIEGPANITLEIAETEEETLSVHAVWDEQGVLLSAVIDGMVDGVETNFEIDRIDMAPEIEGISGYPVFLLAFMTVAAVFVIFTKQREKFSN